VPRVVHPWTWPRAVRDYGPTTADDRNFVLALLALHTFVHGDSGVTYVGVRKWADAARMNVKTLMPLRERAQSEGWLHLSSAGGSARKKAKSVYRLTVPAHVRLDEKDKRLRDVILATYGDVPELYESKAGTDSQELYQSKAGTDGENCGYLPGNGERHPETVPAASKSVPAPSENCASEQAKLCQSKAGTEVCRSSSQDNEACTKVAAATARAAEIAEREKAAEKMADRVEAAIVDHLLAGVDLGKRPKPEAIACIARRVRATDAEIDAAIERLKAAGRLPIKPRGAARKTEFVV
jgi:hypothetical protein